jgi:hypothetical protein
LIDLTDDCPYCAHPLANADVNEDHVFVKAQGGRTVVRAHTKCNSLLGGLVEGALMRPGEQLNLKVLRGHVDGDRSEPVEVNLETRDMRLRPVRKHVDPATETTPEITTYELRGDPGEVRKHLEGRLGKKAGLSAQDVNDLIAKAVPMTQPVNVTTTYRFDLKLSQRLVAKIALGAIGRIAPASVSSPLANALRRVLWGEEGVDQVADPQLLQLVVDQATQLGLELEPLAPSSTQTVPKVPSRVVFFPLGQSTAIFAYLGTMLVSFRGIVVERPCPVGTGLPTCVIDAKGGIRVRDIATEMAHQVTLGMSQGLGEPSHEEPQDLPPDVP